jgi:hypothetical protein
MPSNVRVSSVGDSHAMGRARLKLKLSAIAYASSRHGVDSDAVLSNAGRVFLHKAALDYYEALTGATLHKRPADPHLQRDDARLNLAAIAYANARHGVDADAGLSRAGLALLCSVAIEYCEALVSADPRKRPIDPHLQLEHGA